MTEWNLVKDSEIIKLENENDKVEGVLVSCEHSQKYPDSFGIKIETPDGVKLLFASAMVKEKIDDGGIVKGSPIQIVYKGTATSKNGREYKVYDVYTV